MNKAVKGKIVTDSAVNAEIKGMKPRIAIPEPCSYDLEYSGRALPAYLQAVEAAGGEPVVVPLKSSLEEIARIATSCAAILLPGSKADVDPQKYDAERHAKTAPADSRRDTVDELLLQDAYNMHKPVLAICYGLQILNVYRSGTLVQHIESAINHNTGRAVERAHAVEVEPGSQLGSIMGADKKSREVPVNSSHHQSADVIGDGLRVVARSPLDGVVEALEGTVPGHFVLAVQWHPEWKVMSNPFSRALFAAFGAAAREYMQTRRTG